MTETETKLTDCPECWGCGDIPGPYDSWVRCWKCDGSGQIMSFNEVTESYKGVILWTKKSK